MEKEKDNYIGEAGAPVPIWKERLIAERKELAERVIKLKKFLENPDTKLHRKEWDMLEEQSRAMLHYLRMLTQRCIFYGLIEEVDPYIPMMDKAMSDCACRG